jgi:hypothetical protein
MPVHDWTRVDAGIFHAFHQQWIIAISNALNTGILPEDYYALPEQHAAGFGPDVLTLQGSRDEKDGAQARDSSGHHTGLLVAAPRWGSLGGSSQYCGGGPARHGRGGAAIAS